MRLILWDIDGTLLRAGPVAGEVFATAVEHVIGTHPGEHGVQMSGKTDPQIAREILEVMEVVDDPGRHLPGIMRRLETELAEAAERLRADGRVLPGVEELLARLDATHGVVQTVLTGNIAPNAAAKLSAMGLEHWLDLEVGSYGSDHHDRSELVPIAVDRVRRRYGREPGTIWVVGDTPNDLACARAGGASCLLVATGRYGYADLAAAGPDEVTEDLRDVDAVLALLLGSS
jgi:phosphoglycolate phosphatase